MIKVGCIFWEFLRLHEPATQKNSDMCTWPASTHLASFLKAQYCDFVILNIHKQVHIYFALDFTGMYQTSGLEGQP